MTADIVEDLLEDAYLVAEFGSRTGLLGDSALFEAIQKVEASRKKGREAEGGDIAALQRSLNDAIPRIRPVNLIDLRSDRNPFRMGRKRPFRDQASRYSFVALASVLIIFCAYYLFWVKDAEAIRIQLAANKQDLQYELLVDLYDDLRGLLPISDQLLAIPKAEFDTTVDMARVTLREKINKVRHITQEIEANYDEMTRLYSASNPFLETYYLILGKNVAPRPLEPGTSGCIRYLKLRKQSGEENSDFAGWANVEAFRWQDAYQIQFTKCITGVETIERISSARRPYLSERRFLTDYRPRLLQEWILPALFGMLGAVIYHLRICLDRLRPDPRLGRALMRIFLGGFAGLSFSWFVSPATTSEILGRTLPLGAYTVAFLIGYSIDVFYALLDKVVMLISGWIERISTGTKP